MENSVIEGNALRILRSHGPTVAALGALTAKETGIRKYTFQVRWVRQRPKTQPASASETVRGGSTESELWV